MATAEFMQHTARTGPNNAPAAFSVAARAGRSLMTAVNALEV